MAKRMMSPNGLVFDLAHYQPGFDAPFFHFYYFQLFISLKKSPTSVTKGKGHQILIYIKTPT